MNLPKVHPDVLENLIEYLSLKYPDSLPVGAVTIEGIHIKIGNKQVINTLKEILEVQLRGVK